MSECASGSAHRSACERYEPPFSNRMKIKSAVFKLSAIDLNACPSTSLPEFAFIGRSNVGKSSLINLLCERRDLAKVSATPGKTRLINFFLINDRWHLVDLPGYGFASGRRAERDEFNVAVADYLEHRANIARVFVLIDSRLPPQRLDRDFINWLGGCSVPFALIFTKTDKLSATQTQANIEAFKVAIAEDWDDLPPMFLSSSKTKKGRGEILAYIEETMAEAKA